MDTVSALATLKRLRRLGMLPLFWSRQRSGCVLSPCVLSGPGIAWHNLTQTAQLQQTSITGTWQQHHCVSTPYHRVNAQHNSRDNTASKDSRRPPPPSCGITDVRTRRRRANALNTQQEGYRFCSSAKLPPTPLRSYWHTRKVRNGHITAISCGNRNLNLFLPANA